MHHTAEDNQVQKKTEKKKKIIKDVFASQEC